jgi:hypothetical protein
MPSVPPDSRDRGPWKSIANCRHNFGFSQRKLGHPRRRSHVHYQAPIAADAARISHIRNLFAHDPRPFLNHFRLLDTRAEFASAQKGTDGIAD